MWHVFFLVVFIFVLFLDEIIWWKDYLEVSGLIACRVSNSCKFSYIFTQWGRFLKRTHNVHCFQAEMTSDIQVDNLDKQENVITQISLHIYTVGRYLTWMDNFIYFQAEMTTAVIQVLLQKARDNIENTNGARFALTCRIYHILGRYWRFLLYTLFQRW